jgi:hypothetical protein
MRAAGHGRCRDGETGRWDHVSLDAMNQESVRWQIPLLAAKSMPSFAVQCLGPGSVPAPEPPAARSTQSKALLRQFRGPAVWETVIADSIVKADGPTGKRVEILAMQSPEVAQPKCATYRLQQFVLTPSQKVKRTDTCSRRAFVPSGKPADAVPCPAVGEGVRVPSELAKMATC